MSGNVAAIYGNYTFDPVPLMTVVKEYNKADDGTIVGAVYKITLNGNLITQDIPDDNAGYLASTLKMQELETAFAREGMKLQFTCFGVQTFLCWPRIISVSFNESNNNWVQTIPYTIELEADFEDAIGSDEHGVGKGTINGSSFVHPPYIETASEDWQVEFVEDQKYYAVDLSTVPGSDQNGGSYYGQDASPFQIRITHNVSAKGKHHYHSTAGASTGTLEYGEAWEQARLYVVPRLGLDTAYIQNSGVMNLDPSNFEAYNHYRTSQIDELGGSFSVTETWLVINPSGSGIPGSGRATEEFTASVRGGVDNGLTTVSVEGTITGLESRSYGSNPGDFTIEASAFEAAENYWSAVQSRLLSRAQYAGQSSASRSINATPVSSSFAFNPGRGTITYNYEYNDRPCNIVSGAIFENITITDNHPTDVFARLPVIGRAAGPVLQSLSTVTESTREVNVEVVVQPHSSCSSYSALNSTKPTSAVETFLCEIETDLTGTYSQVFKSQDTESWNPKEGRYTRQITWTYQDCAGSPNTSVC